jgi:hypothetical protein
MTRRSRTQFQRFYVLIERPAATRWATTMSATSAASHQTCLIATTTAMTRQMSPPEMSQFAHDRRAFTGSEVRCDRSAHGLGSNA